MDKTTVEFLLRAKKATYAGKGAESTPSRPESHDLHYREGSLLYIDTYLGGECFAGAEAVWRDGIPIWGMNYVGRVTGEGFSGDFLKETLSLVSADEPYRGPGLYMDGDYVYERKTEGDIHFFMGFEVIFHKKVKVYECSFHGGDIR